MQLKVGAVTQWKAQEGKLWKYNPQISKRQTANYCKVRRFKNQNKLSILNNARHSEKEHHISSRRRALSIFFSTLSCLSIRKRQDGKIREEQLVQI